MMPLNFGLLFWNLLKIGMCRPTVLDNFALLSGHISTLNRLLSSEKMPAFKNYAVIPLALSPEKDTELEVTLLQDMLLFMHFNSI